MNDFEKIVEITNRFKGFTECCSNPQTEAEWEQLSKYGDIFIKQYDDYLQDYVFDLVMAYIKSLERIRRKEQDR